MKDFTKKLYKPVQSKSIQIPHFYINTGITNQIFLWYMSDSGRVDDHQQAKSAKQPVKWKHEQCWKKSAKFEPFTGRNYLKWAYTKVCRSSGFKKFMHKSLQLLWIYALLNQLFFRWLVSVLVSEIYQITCNLLCIFQTWKYFFLCGAVALWYTCACRSPVSIPVHCWEDSRLRSDCNSIEFAH